MHSEKRCKLCQGSSRFIFQSKILSKYDVSYYVCGQCGFLFTEEPYWLEEAYTEAINRSDTGIVARNLCLRNVASVFLWRLFDHRGRFLDYAGGYGLFVRLMRDVGFDFYWEDKHCQNLFARGFEGADGNYELVTAFECFEHFDDPVQELNRIFGKSDSLLFTTDILPNPIPQPESWWYYGLEHGQHISFYSIQSLRRLAESRGLNFYSNGANIHMLTKQRIHHTYFKFLCRLGSLSTKLVQLATKSKVWSDHCYLKKN